MTMNMTAALNRNRRYLKPVMDGSNLKKQMINAMDSKRKILAFKLRCTSKPHEVEAVLQDLRNRGVELQVVYVDDECCGAWSDIVHAMWPGCYVHVDPMHAMRRLTQTTTSPQHPWHSEFCGTLSNAFYTFDADFLQ